MTTYKTPSLSASKVARDWFVIDASKDSFGRIASIAAERLIGKHKPTYSPNIDNGDFIIIINTDKIKVTGKKLDQKVYYRHSGYMGGLRETKLGKQISDDSTKVFISAVRGMLPKNKLQTPRMARLKVYAGAEHQHAAQKPKNLGVN